MNKKNKNIIFLDLDGVIEFTYGKNIYYESIKILQEIIKKYDAKIVLITSLLDWGTISKYKKLVSYLSSLEINNVIGKIDVWLEGTYNNQNLNARTLGIIDYLKNNKGINYVIIDDEYDNEYSLLGLNHIKTDYYLGLRKEDLNSKIFHENNINMGNISYHYRSLENAQYVKATNDFVKTLKKVYELKGK